MPSAAVSRAWSRLSVLMTVVRAHVWMLRRKITGDHGGVTHPESSERASALSAAWDTHWPGLAPIGHVLRRALAERAVRFHSLPESKRYADTPDETREIVHRHRRVLAELCDPRHIDVTSLVIIAQDWGPSHGSGWTKRLHPAPWPWRSWLEDGGDPGTTTYLWVTTGLDSAGLDSLLIDVAEERAHIAIVPPDASWIYCPYDGGADVILPTTAERDALMDTHRAWIPTHH